MNLLTRLRFLTGVIIVLLICGGLFVYLDYSMSRAESRSAQLNADTFAVGVGYSGIIEKQYISEGDQVKKGDPLFELRSPTLADAIKNDEVSKSQLLYKLTDNGNILLTAAADGKVQTIEYRAGAFVPANDQIAIVAIDRSLYVNATYKLSPPDYAQVSRTSKVDVTLPDGKKLSGTVYDISLTKKDDEVETTIRARLPQEDINNMTFGIGTPVDATLHLTSDTWYSKIVTNITNLFQPKKG